MTDTYQHINDIHLKLWTEKTMEERLCIILRDLEQMRAALRQYKLSKNLPLDDLDPVGEYLKMKEKKSSDLQNIQVQKD